jgi:hypothetical protein
MNRPASFTCPGFEPGPFQTPNLERSRTSGAPLRKNYVLHRIRDTRYDVAANAALMALRLSAAYNSG